jgi:GTP-binding protein
VFIDEARIVVRSGRGGNGCVSFRREKFAPHGGPDGGDGGRGGNVSIQAKAGLNTLLDISQRGSYAAPHGGHGEGGKRHGRNGRDVVIYVPPGTVLRDAERGHVLRDLVGPGEQVLVARGGAGGRGNKAFATATNQAPTFAEEGQPGQERTILLELKLIADVGILGMPNAGKSTLLSRLSRARPKIADYPFTTTEPCLGIVATGSFRRFVLADLPGLIEGAHQGTGLGDRFLRHIERTRLLLHLVDVSPLGGMARPAEAYGIVRGELRQYSATLAAKPELVVATKADVGGWEAGLAELREACGKDVLPISAVTGLGLRELVRTVVHSLEELDAGEASPLGVEEATSRESSHP